MSQYVTYAFKPLISTSYYNGTEMTLVNTETNEPIPLTGCQISFSMKANPKAPSAKDFTTADGSIIISNGPMGILNIIGCNMNIAPGNYTFFFNFLFPNGENKIYIQGTWTILPN